MNSEEGLSRHCSYMLSGCIHVTLTHARVSIVMQSVHCPVLVDFGMVT